ncbi:MAG: site-specific DNA-methyltransferase [Acinetobacter sp.]
MPLLHWVNRNQAEETATQVPYHLLKFEKSYGDAEKAKENLIIQGDNLQALKALLPLYGGQVKCIFIDPPYNTQSAFEHYDDKLEHAQWLSMMYPRLVLLHTLLAHDGFICVHLDDKEGSYLKVMLDEIFGRSNYQNTFYIQTRYADKTLKEDMAYHKQIEYLLVYRKSFSAKPIRPKVEAGLEKFCVSISTNSDPSKVINLGGKQVEVYEKSQYEIKFHDNGFKEGLKEIWATGSILDGNSSGRFFRDYLAGRATEDGLEVLYKVPSIGDDMYDFRYFTGPKRSSATKGKYFQGVPLEKLELTEKELPIPNFYDFADRFGNCRHEGGVEFRSGKKPEHYLETILKIFTNSGDLVLDSFLGSGSTAAVAHKMGRKYIGIEMRSQAQTHVVPRLQAVISGEQTGISKDNKWQGGGGFSFYTLGSPVFDDQGFLNADVKFKDLASYVWWLETKAALNQTEQFDNPFLGIHEGTAYYLLYNGILGDRRPNGGNVLTVPILNYLNECHAHEGKRVIIGEASRLGAARLEALNIEFKQIPYSLYGNKAK